MQVYMSLLLGVQAILFCADVAHVMFRNVYNFSHVMSKPAYCISENEGADQPHGNQAADQHLCFRYIDSTISQLSTSEISSL